MTGIDRLFLTQEVRLALLEKKGTAFESFFSEAAIAKWGDDFEPWKPQGKVGDYKCDGYRISTGTVFQCHAPEQPNASRIATKIQTDFNGARAHFGDRMRRWVFVHNQKEIPARAGALLDVLWQTHPDLTIGNWTVTHLTKEVFELTTPALQNLFPQYPLGQELTPDVEEWYAQRLASAKPPLPDDAVAGGPAPNTNAYETAMHELSEVDRDIRRRLLGYSRWFEPAPIAEVMEKLIGLGYGAVRIEANATLLRESNLIKITQRHYLPENLDVCQQAADTLTDEIIEELDE